MTATDAAGNATARRTGADRRAPPPPKPRISSRCGVTWGVAGKRIFLLRLKAASVPGARRSSCAAKGKQCPYKRVSSKKRKKGSITLFKAIKAKKVVGKKQRSFHAGQTLQVRITERGFIGKVVRYKLKKGKIPSGKDLCLPVGKKKPRKRC